MQVHVHGTTLVRERNFAARFLWTKHHPIAEKIPYVVESHTYI